MAQKFIVTDTRMLMGNVDYHKDLLPKKSKDGPPHARYNHLADVEETVRGGGRWLIDNDKKILYLWGASSDFGPTTAEEIETAIGRPDTWLSPSIIGYDVYFSAVVSNDFPDEKRFTYLTKVPE